MKYCRLRAGVAEAKIAARNGLRLEGTLTPRTAKGARAPLFAKALFSSNGEKDLATVTLDLFGLQKEDCDPVANMVDEQSGIKSESVMISCSHTHGAPYTVPFPVGQMWRRSTSRKLEIRL